MNNYFRITAYHPTENISVIMDSNGMFGKLWQFSSFLVQKGFKVLTVGNEETFTNGNIPKTSHDSKHILLRACGMGIPQRKNDVIHVNGKEYVVQ